MTTSPADPRSAQRTAVQAAKQRKQQARSVEVVECPGGFPLSQKPNKRQREPASVSDTPNEKRPPKSKSLLDWNTTVQQVRSYGATAFVGKQKRNFEDEQYKLLTGRHRKKHQVPLPIVRGIQKKAAARHVRELREAKEAGIVLPTVSTKRKDKKGSSASDVHGPAPSIGFMSKGVLRLKKKPL